MGQSQAVAIVSLKLDFVNHLLSCRWTRFVDEFVVQPQTNETKSFDSSFKTTIF